MAEVMQEHDRKTLLHILQNSSDPDDLEHAFRMLDGDIPKRILRSLIEADKPFEVRRRAIHTMDSREFIEEKADILKNDQNSIFRISTINSIRKDKNNGLLLLALHSEYSNYTPDPDPYVRAIAIQGLTDDESDVINAVIRETVKHHAENDPHPYVRIVSVKKMDPHADYDLLVNIMANDDDHGVIYAVRNVLPQVVDNVLYD